MLHCRNCDPPCLASSSELCSFFLRFSEKEQVTVVERRGAVPRLHVPGGVTVAPPVSGVWRFPFWGALSA